MICDDCQGEMERDSVIFVVEVGGRRRSMQQPGWYCWTCKVSRHTAGDDLQPAPRLRRGRIVASSRSARTGGAGADDGERGRLLRLRDRGRGSRRLRARQPSHRRPQRPRLRARGRAARPQPVDPHVPPGFTKTLFDPSAYTWQFKTEPTEQHRRPGDRDDPGPHARRLLLRSTAWSITVASQPTSTTGHSAAIAAGATRTCCRIIARASIAASAIGGDSVRGREGKHPRYRHGLDPSAVGGLHRRLPSAWGSHGIVDYNSGRPGRRRLLSTHDLQADAGSAPHVAFLRPCRAHCVNLEVRTNARATVASSFEGKRAVRHPLPDASRGGNRARESRARREGHHLRRHREHGPAAADLGYRARLALLGDARRAGRPRTVPGVGENFRDHFAARMPSCARQARRTTTLNEIAARTPSRASRFCAGR